MFGTKMADEFFGVHTGGDVAFLNGVLKVAARRGRRRPQVRARAHDRLRRAARTSSRPSRSPTSRRRRARRATTWRASPQMYATAESAVLVWSMGITQHANGVDNVAAIVNLGAGPRQRRPQGRRAHADPRPLGRAGRRRDGRVRHRVPRRASRSTQRTPRRCSETVRDPDRSAGTGMTADEMVEAGARGEIDVLYSSGGNFLDVLPDPDSVRDALERVPVRVHQDIVVSSQMLVDPGRGRGAAARVHPLRAAGRRHRDHDRAPRRRSAPRSRARASARRAASGRSSPTSRRRVRPDRAHLARLRRRRRRPRRDRATSSPRTRASSSCRSSATRCSGAASGCARTACSRPPTARRSSRPSRPRDASARPGAFVLSTRRGKQFNSMVYARGGPAHRRGARRAVPRREGRRDARGAGGRSRPGPLRARRDGRPGAPRADPARQRAGVLPGGQRAAAPGPPATRSPVSPTTTRCVEILPR